MKNVVENGTGFNAQYKSKTAGKTATAQSGIYVDGKEQLNTWFVGFYPYDNPKYSIVVMREGGKSGAGDCCPVFRTIVEKIDNMQYNVVDQIIGDNIMQYSKLKTLLIYNILEKYSDEEHPLSTTDLISMLEEKGVKCERKSIYADIAALNDIGCDIITVTSPKRGFFMASRTFEIPEVMLLIDAVSSAGFITPKKTASLIEKLETLVSVEQAKTMKSQVYVDTSCAKCDNEEIYIIIDRLNNAIADEKKVKFVYRRRSVDVQNRKKHTEKTFTVSPYALIWKDDHYYLVCNNQKYDNLMNLRIDRMKKLEVLDEPSRHFSEVSPYKDKFDEHDYVSKRFNMFSGDECKVTFKCIIQLQEEMLDRFGKNIPLTAVDGNHFETTVTATVSVGFISWLMQYGDGVEVTSPKKLAKMVRDKAKTIYNMYKGKKL